MPIEKRATTPLTSLCSVRRFRAALCPFPFSRRLPASSKACFTKVVSSLSGQRCVVRHLLRSSDFCCVHGTRAHISKQAHTRSELAYQGPSCVHTLPPATAQTEFLPSGLLLMGACAFLLCLGLVGLNGGVFVERKGGSNATMKLAFPTFQPTSSCPAYAEEIVT